MLINNYFVAIAVFILTGFASYGLHSCDVERLDRKYAKEKIDLAFELNTNCTEGQKVTTKIQEQHEKDNYDNDIEFNSYLLRDKESGASLVTVTSQANTPKAAEPEPSKRDGLSVERIDFRVYAKKVEGYRKELNTCLDSLDDIYLFATKRK